MRSWGRSWTWGSGDSLQSAPWRSSSFGPVARPSSAGWWSSQRSSLTLLPRWGIPLRCFGRGASLSTTPAATAKEQHSSAGTRTSTPVTLRRLCGPCSAKPKRWASPQRGSRCSLERLLTTQGKTMFLACCRYADWSLRMKVGKDPRAIMRLVSELFEGSRDSAQRQLETAASAHPGDKDSFYAALYLGLYEESQGAGIFVKLRVVPRSWFHQALAVSDDVPSSARLRRRTVGMDRPGHTGSSLRWIRRSLETQYAQGSFDYMVDVARVHLSRRPSS